LRANASKSIAEDVLDFHILTILFLWTMLVAYHRLYDTLVIIFFVVLFFKGLAVPDIWKLTARQRTALLTMMAILPIIFIIPARLVDKDIAGYYGTKSDAVTTLSLLVLLVISMLLLHRFLQNTQAETIRRRINLHGIPNDPHRDTQPRWTDYPKSSASVKRSK
jgi:hypothetical protein